MNDLLIVMAMVIFIPAPVYAILYTMYIDKKRKEAGLAPFRPFKHLFF